MEQIVVKSILAVVTTDPDRVAGGAPIFFAQSAEEVQRKVFLLENIMDAMAHELDEHTYIIVRH